ncbi:MAG: hypothetical protein WC417_06920 [Candidatus Omnitrophota bacterium]|jgi:hypothetical protein
MQAEAKRKSQQTANNFQHAKSKTLKAEQALDIFGCKGDYFDYNGYITFKEDYDA